MRILVVEDDRETASILKACLEAECYSVDVEHDGDKGSYRARTNRYDLILLDNILPGKHGPEICAELRRYKMDVPVLMLSVRSEVDEKVGVLDCGADDYMTKPYAFAEVSARVRTLLRRPARRESEELRAGDVVLNRSSFAVSCAGRPARLTPKEFSILEYLMKHRGRAVSRAELLEHAWDGEADPFSNTVEAHLWSLRKKIGGARGRDRAADAAAPAGLIRTIPGRGYMISDAG